MRRTIRIIGLAAAAGLIVSTYAQLPWTYDFESNAIGSRSQSGDIYPYDDPNNYPMAWDVVYASVQIIGAPDPIITGERSLLLPGNTSGVIHTEWLDEGVYKAEFDARSYTTSTGQLLVQVEGQSTGLLYNNTYTVPDSGSAPLHVAFTFFVPDGNPLPMVNGDNVNILLRTPNDDWIVIDNFIKDVPEPHLYALAAGIGLMAFAGYRRLRKS